MKLKKTSEKITALRDLVMRSPYAFAKIVCGYQDLTNIHREMERSIILFQQNKRLRIMELWPRGHFKTSMFTKAASLWYLVNNPEERILVLHASSTISQGWIIEMQNIIMSKMFKLLFPELVPDPSKVQWRKDRFTVVRRGNYDVPSVMAGGYETRIVGKHFTKIIVDDLVGPQDKWSLTIRRKKLKFFHALEPLLVAPEQGGIFLTGTRWHIDDIYGHILENLRGPRKFEYRCTVRSALENGKPIFPERFSKEHLEFMMKSMGEDFWAIYMNSPVSPVENPFHYEHLRDSFFEQIPDGKTIKIMVVDPAGPKTKRASKKYREDHSETAIVVAFVQTVNNLPHIYVVETIAGNWDAKKTADIIINTYKKYTPDFFAIEVNSGWLMMEHIIKERAKERGIPHLSVTELRAKEPKESRIYRLRAYIDDNRLHLIKDQHQDLISQLIAYPHSSKWDLMDALAYVCIIIEENPFYFQTVIGEPQQQDYHYHPTDPDTGY